jgi:sugar phosphate isomerase/epimerase
MNHKSTRREFIRGAAVGAVLTSVASAKDDTGRGEQRPIGCFNRPWHPWTYDEALAGIKAAGFGLTGILGDHADEPFLSPPATEEYIDTLRERIESSELMVNAAWLKTRHDVPMEEALSAARRQIDLAHRLGVQFLLTMGADAPETFDHFYEVMNAAAACAEEQGIQIVMKPHGGLSATADEMLRTIERVGHDNFRLWYDAGNVIHYTGADPVADVARVAEYVTGFCAKDCAEQGGDVMLQFGEGSVDFHGVFSALKDAGFAGPVMVECCRAGTMAEVAENVAANREFLERLFAEL